MDMKTHEILTSLYKRSGYTSYEKLAKAMGRAHGSSVQRYFDEEGRKGKYLSADFVEALAGALIGHGAPPITAVEVWQLAGPTIKISSTDEKKLNHSGDALMDFYERSTSTAQAMFLAGIGAELKKSPADCVHNGDKSSTHGKRHS